MMRNRPKPSDLTCIVANLPFVFRQNASLNDVTNVEFIAGKAEDVLPNMLESRLKDAESLVAVVDPPRAGLHKKVLQVRFA